MVFRWADVLWADVLCPVGRDDNAVDGSQRSEEMDERQGSCGGQCDEIDTGWRSRTESQGDGADERYRRKLWFWAPEAKPGA